MRYNNYKGKIKGVVKGSIAEEAGILPGDVLIKINGQNIEDLIQYNMLVYGESRISIELLTGENDYLHVDIDKDYDEDLGIIFENAVIDNMKKCENNCIFCFINQLPPRLRKTLYVKDDDYRLSFFHGNFVTLTNITDEIIERIIKLRISPLYVSVHTTNPKLRTKMLNNSNAGQIMEQLEKLVNGGIEIHCQVVLCPKINDNDELDNTIKDLSSLWPGIRSVGIVPVGLTKYRNKLYPLNKMNKDDAIGAIYQIEGWQRKLKNRIKNNFVFAADEIYLTSGLEFPQYREYEDFPQFENGIGLIPVFRKEFDDIKSKLPPRINKYKESSIITGVSAESFMKEIIKELNRIKNLNVNLIPIENNFFGKDVTVAGLVTGKDLINQVGDKCRDHEVIIPDVMLKDNSNLFLDDVSLQDVKKHIGTDIKVSAVNANDLVSNIIGSVIKNET
ncbi:MAG TPA: DUF512 domain-containing protein [Thermoanaerobacterales bacterium]|nr:DUF512 domain-containing protein [Thermoanaerobacterales bacterium]